MLAIPTQSRSPRTSAGFTTGKLVSAHSYSTWALLRKKLSRHRGVVAVALASMLVLAAMAVESFRRVVAERNIARSQRGLAEDALTNAEKRKRELVLLQAETALPKDPTAALAWLKTYDVGADDRQQGGRRDRRGAGDGRRAPCVPARRLGDRRAVHARRHDAGRGGARTA